jgi:CheY-like chemotaxis protein
MTNPPLSVLLIDDDPHTTAIFEMLMEHYQCLHYVAKDSVDALDYLSKHTPDVIVIDLFLPGLDGFQTFDRVRKLLRDEKCRILATTAYYSQDTRQVVLERGFDGYLPKPFVPEHFMAYLSGRME